ncbi:hypothetical protein BXZ70DRAFT_946491 [Cristinia sonorae]|uniref:Uncharacterized protein n=1 Tax=Cristinia sonorae TaxID=1940300 RepID=A0A8K0UJX5_9AGAR|nr:hypothetical protein BXZ70DRAFT_946491 [Cristinia sonorae]
MSARRKVLNFKILLVSFTQPISVPSEGSDVRHESIVQYVCSLLSPYRSAANSMVTMHSDRLEAIPKPYKRPF